MSSLLTLTFRRISIYYGCSSDRTYGLGERFPLIPDPKLRKSMFAVAGPARVGESEEYPDFSGRTGFHCNSGFKLRVPFAERPMRINANVSSPFPGSVEDRVIPAPLLQFWAANSAFELIDLNLGEKVIRNNRNDVDYSAENREALERLVLVVYQPLGGSLLVPTLRAGINGGLYYSKNISYEERGIPNSDDIKRFHEKVEDKDLLTVDPEEAKIAALEGAFYSISN